MMNLKLKRLSLALALTTCLVPALAHDGVAALSTEGGLSPEEYSALATQSELEKARFDLSNLATKKRQLLKDLKRALSDQKDVMGQYAQHMEIQRRIALGNGSIPESFAGDLDRIYSLNGEIGQLNLELEKFPGAARRIISQTAAYLKQIPLSKVGEQEIEEALASGIQTLKNAGEEEIAEIETLKAAVAQLEQDERDNASVFKEQRQQKTWQDQDELESRLAKHRVSEPAAPSSALIVPVAPFDQQDTVVVGQPRGLPSGARELD